MEKTDVEIHVDRFFNRMVDRIVRIIRSGCVIEGRDITVIVTYRDEFLIRMRKSPLVTAREFDIFVARNNSFRSTSFRIIFDHNHIREIDKILGLPNRFVSAFEYEVAKAVRIAHPEKLSQHDLDRLIVVGT